MLGATDLYDLARTALDAVTGYYTAQGVSLPQRRYVADGLPAWFPGCEQVTSRVVRVYPGSPSAEFVAEIDCLVQYTAVVGLEVVRCAPVVGNSGTPPTPVAVETSAEAVLGDAALLFAAVLNAYRDGEFGNCGGVAYEQWISKGPQGCMVGGELTVRMLLGG